MPSAELERIVQTTGQSLLLTPEGWQLVEGAIGHMANPLRDDLGAQDSWETALPLLGNASAGPGSFVDESGTAWVSVHDWAQRSLDGLVTVVGDSMSPLVEAGQYIGLRRTERIRLGDVIVAQDLRDETIILKVYAGHDRETDYIFLHSVNPAYPPLRLRNYEVAVLGTAHGPLSNQQLRLDWETTE